MSPPSKDEIILFNQELLHHELKNAVLIKRLFKQLLDGLTDRYGAQAIDKIKPYIQEVVNSSLNEMIHASDDETYTIHANRLNTLIKFINIKFSSMQSSSVSLDEYRLLSATQKILKDAVYSDKKKLTDKWILTLNVMDQQFNRFKENPNFAYWQDKLSILASQSSEEDFKRFRLQLINNLINVEHEKDLANSSSLYLIEKNLDNLALVRQSYLEKMKIRMYKDVTWTGIGFLLVSLATVFSFGFPLLIIPGAIVAGATLLHAISDFVEYYNELKQHDLQNLGKRDVHPNTETELQAYAKELGQDVGQLLRGQKQQNEKTAEDNKAILRLGFGLAIAGMVLELGGLILVFPIVTIPIAIIIATVSLSILVGGFMGTLLFFKNSKERIRLNDEKNDVQAGIKRDEKMFQEIELPKPLDRKMADLDSSVAESPLNVSFKPLFLLLGRKQNTVSFKEDEGEEDKEGEGEPGTNPHL